MPDILRLIVFGGLTLGVIVFVHELGHFIAARLVGVRVIQFSIGFGRRITGFTRGDTDYRLSILPLGGYVKMAGDNIEEERDGTPEEFLSRKWYERAFIAVAGPAANFVMAIACGILLFAAGAEYPLHPNVIGPIRAGTVADSLGLRQGETVVEVNDTPTPYWTDVLKALDDARAGKADAAVSLSLGVDSRSVVVPHDRIAAVTDSLLPNIPAEVGQVTVGMPAFQAGLHDGDVVVAIDGLPILSWWDLLREISAKPGVPVEIVLERDGARLTRTVTPADQDGVGRIGVVQVSFGTGVQRFGPVESVKRGVGYTLSMCGGFLNGLKKLVSKPQSLGSNLAGPIAIVQMSADQVQRGRTDLLNWVIFLSIALMTMNLLPIPVLDGGHILIAVIEGVTQRPLKPKIMVAIWRVGMVFLLALMTYAIANDGLKLWQRSRADDQDAPVEAPTDATPQAGAGG